MRLVKRQLLSQLATALLLLAATTGQADDGAKLEARFDPVGKYRKAAIERWEKDIQRLESLDEKEKHPKNAILFTGSSSIRRWEKIAEDMKPWPVIRRGYGGARFSDLAVFIERIAEPHSFDALVMFVGNDIAGKDNDKEPEEVLRIYKYIVRMIRKSHPNQPIFCIAVTPTSSRFAVWPRVKEMNDLLKDHSEETEGLYFIDTAAAFLKNGKPRDELFVKDLLHLNDEGYELWAKIIKNELSSVLGDAH